MWEEENEKGVQGHLGPVSSNWVSQISRHRLQPLNDTGSSALLNVQPEAFTDDQHSLK